MPIERRSVLEPAPAASGPTSPWRWLLVVVPLVIMVGAGGLVVRSLGDRIVTASEDAIGPASRPPFPDETPRPGAGDRSPLPSPDLSWILKDTPARPSPPRSGEQQAPSDQWAFKAAEVVSRLRTADPQNGSAVFKRCVPCHAAEPAAGHRLGPRLWGIVGRPKASYRDFTYSQALKAQEGGRWTYEELARYLYDTRAAVPGGSMAFAGIRDPDRLAEVIMFMRTLAETPVPLP